jgi:hypothetical protein
MGGVWKDRHFIHHGVARSIIHRLRGYAIVKKVAALSVSKMKMKRVCSIISIILILAVGGYVSFFLWGTGVARSWRNIDRNTLSPEMQDFFMMPSGATDITCWMRGGFGGQSYFECRLSRDQLDSYLKLRGWRLKPISGFFDMYCPFEESQSKTFSIGEYYEESNEGGGGISLVFLPESRQLFLAVSAR